MNLKLKTTGRISMYRSSGFLIVLGVLPTAIKELPNLSEILSIVTITTPPFAQDF